MGSDHRRRYQALAAVRLLWSLAWAIAICVWSDRAAWFLSGALVATHVTAGLLFLVAATWHVFRDRALAAGSMGKVLRRHFLRHALLAVTVSDAAGLVFIILYAVNIYGAGTRANASGGCPAPDAATAVARLSCQMWIQEPALTIVVLAALGATLILHLVTIGLAAAHLARLLRPRDDSVLITEYSNDASH